MRLALLLLAMGCGTTPEPGDTHTWTEAHAQLDEQVLQRLPGFELEMSAAWIGLAATVDVTLPEDAPEGADIIFYVTHQGVDAETCAPRRRGCIQLRYPIGWAARQVMSGGRTAGGVHFTVPEFLEDGQVLSVQAVLEHGDRVYTSPVVQRVIGDGDGDGVADEA